MTLSFGGGAGVLTIPGFTSDGADGVDVAGDVTAVNVTASGKVTSAGLESSGRVAIKGAPSAGPAQLGVGSYANSPYNSMFSVGVDGEVTVEVVAADYAVSALYVARQHPPSFTYGGPLVKFVDFADESQHLMVIEGYKFSDGSLLGRFRVGLQGGIDMFDGAPMTAPRTLPQATITAITDANAKSAVQALANALSDMGALTLT